MLPLHSDQCGRQWQIFSCAAVPVLVPAKEDQTKLGCLFFSELYILLLILLLFTPFTVINLI